MSTDTMYFNSSRRLQAAGKNKTSQLQKPEKKQSRNKKKSQMRQDAPASETLPKPQTLPNGERPDFGNSSKKNKGMKNYGNSGNTKKSGADVAAQPKKNGTRGGVAGHVDPYSGPTTPATSSVERSAVRQLTPQSMVNASPGASPAVSPLPIASAAPMTISPLPHQPGLYQQQHQQHQFQQNVFHNHQLLNHQLSNVHQPQYPPQGYPMGLQQPNYALSSGGMPYFTSPQAPLMGLPPQQVPQYFGMPHPPPPMTIMPGHFPHTPPVLNTTPPAQKYQGASPSVSAPPTAECSGPATTVPEEPRSLSTDSASTTFSGNKRSSKKSRAAAKLSSGGYAGASFATSLPSITNLPKPS